MSSSSLEGQHPDHPHRTARAHISWATALLVLVAAIGCSTGPPPGPDLEAEGKVILPPGSALSLSDLVAVGPFGDAALASDGAFTVPMAASGTGLVLVTDRAGNLVLMGFLDTTKNGGEVTATSTAAVLLYLAVGGPFMPGDAAHVVELVNDDAELTGLTATVSATLAARPLGLADGDQDLIGAVLAARDAIAARRAVDVRTVQPASQPPAGIWGATSLTASVTSPQAVQGSGNVIITDAGVRGGFDLLISDDGYGVTVQNDKRRPARLLPYQTGVKSQDGPVVQFSTGRSVGEPVTVPPTRAINLFKALEDVFGGVGGSPLAPIESESVTLPLLEGTTRTYYTAVLLAPSLVPGDTPPIFTDSRFFPFRSQWDTIVDDLQFETWWTSLLFPLMSTMAFGVTGQVAYSSVAALTPGVKGATAPLLAAEGITNPMTGDRARTMTLALEKAALGADSSYFYDMVEYTRLALDKPPVPQSSLLSARNYMRALAGAASVAAVVDAVLSSADIIAMLTDMASNGPAEAYNPVRLQTTAEIRPREGQVQRLVAPSQTFNLIIDEPLGGCCYLYRWSTTGEYGYLSDYLHDGTTLDSTSDEILYLANEPAVITPELFDEITVAVYLDDGSGTIAPGADPVTFASATVVGKEKRDLIMGHSVLVNDSYPEGDHTRYCTAAYVAFERQPDAREYAVDAFNFYDQYYWGGHYGATVFEQANFNPYVPPCDQHRTPILVGNEIYLFLSGGHGPSAPDDSWFGERFGGMIVEVRVTY